MQARLKKCETMAKSTNTDRGALLVWKTRKAILSESKAELDMINVLLKECPEAGHASNAGLLEDQLRSSVMSGQTATDGPSLF